MMRQLLHTVSDRRPGLSILIFHRVLAARDELFPGEVTVEDFDAICGWLAQWCTVLPLDEAIARRARGDLPPAAVSISFDDGYADNHERALPILQRHGLNATFFIATAYLEGGCMWNDRIIDALRHTGLDRLEGQACGLEADLRWPLVSVAQRRAAVVDLLHRLKHRPPEVREEASRRVQRAALGEGRGDPRLMMSREQVRALRAAGMGIGAHTHRHPILAAIDESQAFQDIAHGREVLAALLGEPVDLFAYPNGRPQQDYTDRDVALVRRMGFKAAVSTRWGVARAHDDPWQLPRYTPWDRTRLRFGLRLAREWARP